MTAADVLALVERLHFDCGWNDDEQAPGPACEARGWRRDMWCLRCQAADALRDAVAARDAAEKALILREHPVGECPTWLDGCNCTVENLLHNMDRADAAEKERDKFRKEWEWLDHRLQIETGEREGAESARDAAEKARAVERATAGHARARTMRRLNRSAQRAEKEASSFMHRLDATEQALCLCREQLAAALAANREGTPCQVCPGTLYATCNTCHQKYAAPETTP